MVKIGKKKNNNGKAGLELAPGYPIRCHHSPSCSPPVAEKLARVAPFSMAGWPILQSAGNSAPIRTAATPPLGTGSMATPMSD